LQRDFQLTYLFISHSLPVVRYLATRIAVMKQGELVELGTTEQIVSAPRHEYTRALLAATPELETAST
jgi:peptide/nickel transport system ATP-binding protein